MESVRELEDSLAERLADNPFDLTILNKLGYIYLHSNNLLKSEDFYLRSLAVEADQFEPYVSLGLINTITMRLGKALYFLLKAKIIHPDSPDLSKSIEEINSAIISKDGELSDADFEKWFQEAGQKANEGNYQEAIETFLKLFCLFPENELIALSLGETLLKNEEIELADYIFQEILSKKPLSPMLNYYKSICSNQLRDFSQALIYANKALELKPSLADILYNGKLAHFKKNYEEEVLTECPLCHSESIETAAVINQSVYCLNFNLINPLRKWSSCQKCDLVFANPRPSEKILKNYSIELSLNSGKIIEDNPERIWLETEISNERINIIDILTSRELLIDLWPDSGLFTQTAENKGWETSFLAENKLKKEKLKKITNKDGLDSVDLAEINENSYTVVTCWSSIEKIKNLREFLKNVRRLLKNDGVFAFSFHGLDSYLAKASVFSYPAWYYPDFLYFYPINLLKKELENNGFEVVINQINGKKSLANVDFFCRKTN